MKKGKIMLLGLAVLAAASVGTTWAAWSQVIRTGNESASRMTGSQV